MYFIFGKNILISSQAVYLFIYFLADYLCILGLGHVANHWGGSKKNLSVLIGHAPGQNMNRTLNPR